jgi:tRNA pseudouridine38-40 synthase
MRYFLRLSYNGSAFSGWQIQDNARSVQGELEKALSIRCGEPVSVTGSGRTDAGVNASGYIAHFDTGLEIGEDASGFLYKINAILPQEIVVENVCRVADGAHARFDAVSRTYRYRLHNKKDPFADRSLPFYYPLDLQAMNSAAAHLLGRRDFTCFEKTGGDNKTSICDVSLCRWTPVDSSHFVFEMTADRFLRNMVRATVGTLLEIGRGRRPVEWIDEVLASKDRCAAGQSVKGEPLCLCSVVYPYPLEWMCPEQI